MAKPKIVRVTGLQDASRDLLSAHAAVKAGIATHAEKHETVLEQRRSQVAQNRKIAEGIARNAKQLCSDCDGSPAVKIWLLGSNNQCRPRLVNVDHGL